MTEPANRQSGNSHPRRTTYAVAIETRAKAIQEALGVQHYDAVLERIDQIRTYCDHLEMEIRREREANPQHVARWDTINDEPDNRPAAHGYRHSDDGSECMEPTWCRRRHYAVRDLYAEEQQRNGGDPPECSVCGEQHWRHEDCAVDLQHDRKESRDS